MSTDLALVTEIDAANPVLGDLRVDGGVIAMVTDADAIAQEIQVRLRWWRGEWFADTSLGVPYLQELLGKGVTEATIRTMLKREIEDVDGVGHVESIEIDADRQTRFATITIVVVTEAGEKLELGDLPLGTR